MKKCIKCQRLLDLRNFYRHKEMADGRLNKCKDCVRGYAKEQYEENIKDPEWLKAERKRCRDRNERLGYAEKYKARTRKQKAAIRAAKDRWSRRNSVKKAASVMVNNAVRDGRLKKGPCEVCGTTDNIHGHHDDYSKPLDVRWLCSKHHREHHRKD